MVIARPPRSYFDSIIDSIAIIICTRHRLISSVVRKCTLNVKNNYCRTFMLTRSISAPYRSDQKNPTILERLNCIIIIYELYNLSPRPCIYGYVWYHACNYLIYGSIILIAYTQEMSGVEIFCFTSLFTFFVFINF